MGKETIFALSSGIIPSGIAVIRISGPAVRFVFETMVGKLPEPRRAIHSDIRFPECGDLIDKGIVLFFPEGRSFTGEDCGEFQVHGSRAVVSALADALGSFNSVRMAEAGEFSKRAFENGLLDLVEIEGLSDLIAAKTDRQRILALSSSSGELSRLYDGWRSVLIELRSSIEATLDFSDEEDVFDIGQDDITEKTKELIDSVEKHLDDQNRGEIIQNGFKIALMGSPNSGKSSLINALANRDVSIVSEFAGTTRDVVEVSLDLAGYEVVVSDTAGIRTTSDVVENLGIDRAISKGKAADLVVWLCPVNEEPGHFTLPEKIDHENVLVVHSKSDLIKSGIGYGNCDETGIMISTVSPSGLTEFITELKKRVSAQLSGGEDLLIVRHRHRDALYSALASLKVVVVENNLDPELICEQLRLASNCLGKIVGKIDVEDLLDTIFSKFCIGK